MSFTGAFTIDAEIFTCLQVIVSYHKSRSVILSIPVGDLGNDYLKSDSQSNGTSFHPKLKFSIGGGAIFFYASSKEQNHLSAFEVSQKQLYETTGSPTLIAVLDHFYNYI